MSLQERLRAAALAYAKRGWHVFPLLVGSKEPATARGFYDATLDLATIGTWWRWTPHNIGIATGPISRLFVVDFDPGSDQEGLTPTVETGRGFQRYFEADLDLPSTAGRLGPHIDTRGTGGYVVAPLSIHPNGKEYRFCHQGDWSPDGLPILTSPPDWLIERVRRKPHSERAIEAAGLCRQPRPRLPHPFGYGQAAMAGELKILAATPKGRRNDALNRGAFCLGQLVAGGELTESEVVSALIRACEHNGLMADDGWPSVHRTILSGLTAGMKLPRGRAA
jgi:putative DNA primase/helicase